MRSKGENNEQGKTIHKEHKPIEQQDGDACSPLCDQGNNNILVCEIGIGINR
jgi:hypothetical protein